MLPGNVSLSQAREAFGGCQAIAQDATRWVPPPETERLARYRELCVAVGSGGPHGAAAFIPAVPLGAEYLSAPVELRAALARAGAGIGQVLAASPMPYTPWGELLLAAGPLYKLAEALPAVVTWEADPTFGMDALSAAVITLSTTPGDDAALEHAATLVACAWGEAFRALLDLMAAGTPGLPSDSLRAQFAFAVAAHPTDTSEQLADDLARVATSSPTAARAHTPAVGTTTAVRPPPGAPIVGAYTLDDLMAGVTPPPLTLAQLQLAADYCSDFHPSTTEHAGLPVEPWVVVAAGVFGLASFAGPSGDTMSRADIAAMVGDAVLVLCAAAWLNELARRASSALGPGGAGSRKAALLLYREGLNGRDLALVSRAAHDQHTLLAARRELPATDPTDKTPAAVHAFLYDRPRFSRRAGRPYSNQLPFPPHAILGDAPTPTPAAERADASVNHLPGFAAPVQIDLSQLREAVGHCAEYKPNCLVTPAPVGTPVPAWVILHAARMQLSPVCKVDGRPMPPRDVTALAGVTALTVVDAAAVFALTHASRLGLDTQHLAASARQEALLQEAFAAQDRALVERLYLRQYALLISGGALLAPDGYLLGEGATGGWGARASWGLAVREFNQLLSEFSSVPEASARPVFADAAAALATALTMAGDPGVDDAPATLCGFANPAPLDLPLLREAIGHCANYAPDYDVYRGPDGRPVPAWVILRAARLGLAPVTGISGAPMSRGDVEALAGPAALITTEAEWASGFTNIVSASLDGPHVAAYARQSALLHDAYDRKDQDQVTRLFLREIALLVSTGVVTTVIRDGHPDTPETAWGVACAEFDELLSEFPTAGAEIQDTPPAAVPDTMSAAHAKRLDRAYAQMSADLDTRSAARKGAARLFLPLGALLSLVGPPAVRRRLEPWLQQGYCDAADARLLAEPAGRSVPAIQDAAVTPQGTHADDYTGRCSDSGTTFGLWGRYALGMAAVYATIRFGVSWLFTVLPSWAAFAVALVLAAAAFWLTRNSRNAWLAHWLGTGHVRHGRPSGRTAPPADAEDLPDAVVAPQGSPSSPVKDTDTPTVAAPPQDLPDTAARSWWAAATSPRTLLGLILRLVVGATALFGLALFAYPRVWGWVAPPGVTPGVSPAESRQFGIMVAVVLLVLGGALWAGATVYLRAHPDRPETADPGAGSLDASVPAAGPSPGDTGTGQAPAHPWGLQWLMLGVFMVVVPVVARAVYPHGLLVQAVAGVLLACLGGLVKHPPRRLVALWLERGYARRR